MYVSLDELLRWYHSDIWIMIINTLIRINASLVVIKNLFCTPCNDCIWQQRWYLWCLIMLIFWIIIKFCTSFRKRVCLCFSVKNFDFLKLFSNYFTSLSYEFSKVILTIDDIDAGKIQLRWKVSDNVSLQLFMRRSFLDCACLLVYTCNGTGSIIIVLLLILVQYFEISLVFSWIAHIFPSFCYLAKLLCSSHWKTVKGDE